MTKLFKHSNKFILFFAGLSLLSLSTASLSENRPADEPVEKIQINADHMQMNLESGKSIYRGHVKISQGSLQLTGDEVTLEQQGDEIDRLTVTGKPARYKHVTEQGQSIEAESEHMVYSASQNKLIMTINARLQQPDHQLSSQKITYDTKKGIVIAGSQAGQPPGITPESPANGTKTETKQRVNITLTPKKSSPDKPATEK